MIDLKSGDKIDFVNERYPQFMHREYTVREQVSPSTVVTTDGHVFQRDNVALRRSVTPDPISPTAFKADDGKQRFDLLMTKEGCAKAIADVVSVLTFAVAPKPAGKGYVPHSWREVPEGRRRYLSALYRHLAAIERGEEVDEESGLPHMAHVATNALFLCELPKES